MNSSIAYGLKYCILLCGFVIHSICLDAKELNDNEHLRETDLENRLTAVVPELLKAYAVPVAAVGVIQNNEVVYKKIITSEAGVNLNSNTIFNLGSVSKTVTAWGVLTLVERGLVDLDQPVEKYLKKWQLPKSEFSHHSITVRSLLSHTGGISMWGVPEFTPSEKVPTLLEALSATTDGQADVRVEYEPNTRWQYSGGGYGILQLLIEEVSNQKFQDYMKDRVFAPLKMNDSSFLWDDKTKSLASVPHDAAGHPFEGQRFSFLSAAGLQSSLPDMLLFVHASLATGKEKRASNPLSLESIKLMQQPAKLADHYGLGFEIFDINGVVVTGHSGQNEGWMSKVLVSSSNGAGLVVLTNGTNGLRVINEIECLWSNAVFSGGCNSELKLPIKISGNSMAELAGTYINDKNEKIKLNYHDDNLFWETDYGYEFALRARSDHEYYFVVGESNVVFHSVEKDQVIGFKKVRGESEQYYRKIIDELK